MLIPVISEKSLARVEAFNEYTFAVGRNTDKAKIKEEVEKMFSVRVLSVRTKNEKGKSKRGGKLRRVVLVPDSKQAVVRLDKKDKITLFEIKENKTK